jgi:hypothetical protein
MNERIKQLAIRAGCDEASVFRWTCSHNELESVFKWICSHNELERFADLVREDEAKACAEHYLGIMRDAVEQAVLKEREACASLLEDWSKHNWNIWDCAEAIRARSNDEQYKKQQALDKKADNARELGLDYEVDKEKNT